MLTGFHATIFVYGQTGSGKTFTMEGYKYTRGTNKDSIVPQINRKTASALPAELSSTPTSSKGADENSLQASLNEEGVMPRAIRELFAQVTKKRAETQGKSKISVKIQYI